MSVLPWNCFNPARRWPGFESLGHYVPLLDIAALEAVAQLTRATFPNEPIAAVEIGSFTGTTARLLGEHFNKIICIDTWEASQTNDPINQLYKTNGNKVWQTFLANVMGYPPPGFAIRQILRETSQEAAQHVKDESVHLVWIDGDHSFEAVDQDIRLYWPKIKNGGFMMGHDLSQAFPGVEKAVRKNFGERFLTSGCCCWLMTQDKANESSQA